MADRSTNRPTNHPTDQQTDMRGHKKVNRIRHTPFLVSVYIRLCKHIKKTMQTTLCLGLECTQIIDLLSSGVLRQDTEGHVRGRADSLV